MYRYDEFDDDFVRDRIRRFRSQIDRRISGNLTEEEFKPLRLQNGLYLQLHAYMLRIAIPYGTLDSRQLRQLASISEKWDCGYGHFTTRQNIQLNWPKLSDVGDILDALADVATEKADATSEEDITEGCTTPPHLRPGPDTSCAFLIPSAIFFISLELAVINSKTA